MVGVNTSAVQAMSKWVMVWNKTEVAVAGGDRTKQNLNNPHVMGLLARMLKKTPNCNTANVNKSCIKNGMYLWL